MEIAVHELVRYVENQRIQELAKISSKEMGNNE